MKSGVTMVVPVVLRVMPLACGVVVLNFVVFQVRET